MGPDGTVIVADRENSRLQFFSPDGQFLKEWTDVARPCQVVVDAAGRVYVAELGYRAGMWPGTTAPEPGRDRGPGQRLRLRRPAAGPLGRRGEPCAPRRLLRAPRPLPRFAGRPLRRRGDLVGGRQSRRRSRRLPLAPEIRPPGLGVDRESLAILRFRRHAARRRARSRSAGRAT